MTYSEKLKDPRWQRKRLEVLNRSNFKCENCGDKKTTLHVHHPSYKRGLNPWDYDAEFLKVLCERCHETATDAGARLDKLKSLPVGELELLADLLIESEGIGGGSNRLLYAMLGIIVSEPKFAAELHDYFINKIFKNPKFSPDLGPTKPALWALEEAWRKYSDGEYL